MIPISFFVDKLLKPILKDCNPSLLVLQRNWENIMGSSYCKFCNPEKITFQKNKKGDGVLYVKVFNNIASFYIVNNVDIIVEKINVLYGYRIVKDIKVKQDPKLVL